MPQHWIIFLNFCNTSSQSSRFIAANEIVIPKYLNDLIWTTTRYSNILEIYSNHVVGIPFIGHTSRYIGVQNPLKAIDNYYRVSLKKDPSWLFDWFHNPSSFTLDLDIPFVTSSNRLDGDHILLENWLKNYNSAPL